MGDLLGYVRLRVNRKNSLLHAVEAWLDNVEFHDGAGHLADPPGTIGRLYLYGNTLRFFPRRECVPVAECLADGNISTP